MHEHAHALALLVAAGGPLAPRRALLEAAAEPCAAVADRGLWAACRLTPAQAAVLRQPPPDLAGRLRHWLDQPGNRVVGWRDDDYPPALRHAASPPIALFVSGDPALLWRPSIAVVGSRGPTPAGRQHASEFARAFAQAGLVVGSGLAAGIDTAAHRAALDCGGASLAVLGTGPDVAYPRANAGLHRELAVHGALLSEHLPGTAPRREHFPSRNRLLAALCVATVVVEAAERSGAMITARLAADAGREVFALPGSIRNPLALGCHRLIRDGAGLATSPQDVLASLADAVAREAAAARGRIAPQPDLPRVPAPAAVSRQSGQAPGEHHILWHALGFDPTDMDELAERTGLTPPRLSSMLLGMELDGRVAQQHGRYYRVG
jgi:DNA processing protein